MRERHTLNISLYDSGDNITKVDKDGKFKIHANNCNTEHIDYWVGNTEGWNLSDKDLDAIGLSKILNLSKTDIKDKTFYRYPDLSLPRQKVDLLKEKHNIKVTRKMDSADYKIVSKKFLSKVIVHSWDNNYNKSVVYSFLKELVDKDLVSNCATNFFRLMLQETPTDAMFKVQINNYMYSSNKLSAAQDHFLEEVGKIRDEHFERVHNNRSMVVGSCKSDARKNDVELYKSMFHSNIVLDETIVSIIDEGLAIISNDQYDDVEKMITSGNIDDRSIAIEMLANCNVNKSFDVVSGLYYWHYDWMKNTNNWNSVNIKSFRAQMKNYEGNHDTNGIWSFNNYIQKLAEDGKLTKFAVDRTREKLLKTFLSSAVGEGNDVFNVKLENLTIADQFKEQIIDE